MKKKLFLASLVFLCSCHYVHRTVDEFSYKSITGRKANVYVTLAGQLVEYKNATVKYSETNSSTILLVTEGGKDIYIQGPVILEFTDASQF